MDQETVVNDRLRNGRKLLEALRDAGLDISLAFWARDEEDGRWLLHVVTPEYEAKGPRAVYGRFIDVVRNAPALWFDVEDLRAVGVTDSIALDATAAVNAESRGRFGPNWPEPGLLRLEDFKLAGVPYSEAYVYPPPAAVQTP